MSNFLRWLLVIPVSLLVWGVSLFVGTLIFGYFERALCPPEDLVSGYCDNTMVRAEIELLFSVVTAFTAIAVVAIAATMAPTKKVSVAWGALAIGSLVAYLLDGFGVQSLSAVVGGSLAAAATTAYYRKPNPSFKRDALKRAP
jgi:hypothetical protein